MSNEDDESHVPTSVLRVACLLPSATDIIVSLGLLPNLVGVTHECDNRNIFIPNTKIRRPHIETLTVSQIDPHKHSQSDIHKKVQESLYKDISLYTIEEEAFQRAQPTVILTQTLCEVCAPSITHVRQAVDFLRRKQCEIRKNNNLEPIDSANNEPIPIKIASLEPECLKDVSDTFVEVAEICGVIDRGNMLKDQFWNQLHLLKDTIDNCSESSSTPTAQPKVFMLEWLQPPFDGGHWVLDQIHYGGCINAALVPSDNTNNNHDGTMQIKSKEISWAKIEKSDPDCIVVACCGFDLDRNIADAKLALPQLKNLRAFRNNRIYAADGNTYFARPGPYLVGGAAILARCAYDGISQITKELDKLDFVPKHGEGWVKVEFDKDLIEKENKIIDIEDLNKTEKCIKDRVNYMKAHKAACDAKEKMYIDPESGFSVFTEYGHLQRGKCCGSGCRHCPYNHQNLKDKVGKMKQPAFMYMGEKKPSLSNHFLSILDPPEDGGTIPVKILFFSGGKDSFLTIRALVKQYLKSPKSARFALILLTTFDATSRIIAHQEIHISTVLKQAKHLQIPLIGVPVHRGSSERYVDRIHRALSILGKQPEGMAKFLKVESLVFGDLHLDHIRHWRDTELSGLKGFAKYRLEYPLWKVPYEDLMNDLELSKVPVEISACTVGDDENGMKTSTEKSEMTVTIAGTLFTRKIWEEAVKEGLDGFGENGEFHSLSQVWKVEREVALGFPFAGKVINYE